MSEVRDIFNNFEDPFDTVSTTYMQDSNLKKQFKVVEAEEIEISQTASFEKRSLTSSNNKKSLLLLYSFGPKFGTTTFTSNDSSNV